MPIEEGRTRSAAALQRWRLVIARPAGPVPQREHERAWEEALVASGLPCLRSTAAHGAPRITFAAPLPVGVAGEAELAEILLTERLRSVEVRSALEAVVPAATRLLDLHDVWLGAPGLPSLVVAADYRFDLDPGVAESTLATAIAGLLAATSLPRVRGSDRTYDLRPLVASVALELASPARPEAPATTTAPPRGQRLHARLRHDPALGTGRPDELLAALGDLAGLALEPVSVVRERLVLSEEASGPTTDRKEGSGPSAARG